MKRAAVAAARRVVLLADSGKHGAGALRPLRRPRRRGPADHRQRAEPRGRRRHREPRHGSSARMILTVTPNPCLDRTYEVPSLDRGEVIRATGERVDPGGKGVNVSRAVAAAGRRTVAVLPLGGAPGALVAELLDAQGIEVAPVPVAGAHPRPTSRSPSPTAASRRSTRRAPNCPPAEQELLLETVRAQSADADWIACCGSLPRGLRARVVRRPRRPGARRGRPDRPRHLRARPARRAARASRRGQAERRGTRGGGRAPPRHRRRRGQGGGGTARTGRAAPSSPASAPTDSCSSTAPGTWFGSARSTRYAATSARATPRSRVS